MESPSIPNQGTEAIAQAAKGLETQVNNTNGTAKENADQLTNQQSKDSKVEPQVQTDDTQKKVDDELAKVKSELVNQARVNYETMRDKVSRNPDEIYDIARHDEKTANKIIKSLWSESHGVNTVKDLQELVDKDEKYKKIEDPATLETVKELDQVKKELAELKSHQSKRVESEALETLYKKYPSLHPDNDKDNSKWKTFKEEFDYLNPSLPLQQRLEKASKLALGDVDEFESKELQKSLANIPSGGATSTKKPVNNMSDTAISVAKRLGLTEDDLK